MIPKIQFGLGVDKGGVYIRFVTRPGATEIKRKIKSVEDFITFIKTKARAAGCEPDDLIIMCSSSMDFPSEYNKDPKVIKLAKMIRG
jgi:hypothetical protein